MSRGHGALGLVANLRPFLDLLADSGGSRNVLLEFAPGIILPTSGWTWADGTGQVFKLDSIAYVYQGVVRDIVSLDAETTPRGLVRVETVAACLATEGTYFYDIGSAGAPLDVPTGPTGFWDDGITVWDGSVAWDNAATAAAPTLYVHLVGGANPQAVTCIAGLGFYYSTGPMIPGQAGDLGTGSFLLLEDGSKLLLEDGSGILLEDSAPASTRVEPAGSSHPSFGPDKLVDGDLDLWSSPTALTNWTASLIGAGGSANSINRDGALKAGTYSCRLEATLSAAGGYQIASNLALSGVAGGIYRVSGYYQTDAALPAGVEAQLQIDTGATTFLENGRDTAAAQRISLGATYGEVRRFFIDFLLPADTAALKLIPMMWNTGGGSASACKVWFDGLRLKRIWRFNYYEPRLDPESVPETEIKTAGIYFSDKSIALGGSSLLNGDGALDRIFGSLYTINRPMALFVGGAWGDRQECYKDDFVTAFTGLIQTATVEDSRISVELEDARTIALVQCPPHAYSLAQFPNMDLRREGYRRPLIFRSGTVNAPPLRGVPLTRIGYSSVNGRYGRYDKVDAIGDNLTEGPAATVYFYLSEEAAQRRDTTARIAPIDYFIPAPGNQLQIDIAHNCKVIKVEAGLNDSLDFNIGAGALVAVLTPGLYLVDSGPGDGSKRLAVAIAAALQAVAGGTFTGSYDTATEKITIAKSAGTFQIILDSTAANRDRSAWPLAGFTSNVSKTGSLSYVGDTALFSDPDQEHFLRGDFNGGIVSFVTDFFDPPTTSGEIAALPAMAHWLLRYVAQVPRERIDVESFRPSKQSDQGIGVEACLYESEALTSVLARIEQCSLADILVGGDGVWRYRPYSPNAVVAAAFADSDYLSWQFIPTDAAQFFSAVRVRFAFQPDKGSWRTIESRPANLSPLLFGSAAVMEVDTYIADGIDNAVTTGHPAQSLADRLARLDAATPSVAIFSARTKLQALQIGDIITLTRSRAATATGSLVGVRFRIKSLKHNYVSGVSSCEAVEDTNWYNG
jgi:hypothetical protein